MKFVFHTAPVTSMTSVTQSIQDQYDRLPDGERKIADVLLGMQNDLAAYSATELAARAGVSKATATRLVRRLGFEDFQQMRQRARESRQAGSPLAALPRLAEQRGTLGAHLDHDVSRLVQTVESLPADQVRRAIDILAAAERLWVIGFRNSYAFALYARALLMQVKPDVRLLPAAGQTVAEELSALSPGDAMLMLGFRRRPPILTRILRAASEAQVPVVLLSDPSLGVIDKWAEVTLRCLTGGSSLFDSYVAPVSLINYLCAGVAATLGDNAQARLRRTEQLHDAFAEL